MAHAVDNNLILACQHPFLDVSPYDAVSLQL